MSHAFADAASGLDPLAGFDLDALTRGGARLRPDRVAMSDSSGAALSFAALDARADEMAGRLVDVGLAPGETLMIVGGASVSTCVALIAAMRAGLDAALAPPHPSAALLGSFAARAGARAIAAQNAHGELTLVDDVFEAAARAQDVRLVCGLGPGQFDGAVDLSSTCADPPSSALRPAASPHVGRIATFASGGGVVSHRQRALVAAALDLAARARVGMTQPLLSTIGPASFAGLVAGPFLSLLSGAPLHLHGPFESAFFLAEVQALAPAHIVAPGALCGSMAEGGLLRPGLIASLMLLDRTQEARGALAPLGDTRGVPVIDLHAFGEYALIAEPRGPDGRPLPAAREPHMIDIGDIKMLAVKRREGAGPLAFEGEAVSASQ